MIKISELPNILDYPLRALAELRANEYSIEVNLPRIPANAFTDIHWSGTKEGYNFWQQVNEGQRPPIPASSLEDLRKAGMMPAPSITLSDYARMEAEHEAITSPAHYKVCEGLDVVDMIRAVLTPEQFSGYCLGNVIKYRMRAGKKTMSPMEDLGKAHVYETWLAEMEGGEG
jgi:hypothetical protein